MTSAKFEKLYGQLNPEQRAAVDAVEGPVMVVAGPGTGKTQILTLRIANILRRTDIEPENILALTFTESGVSAMRRRLLEIIGAPAYRVAINTFHGFCNDIIKNYPEAFPRIIGSENITEVEQIGVIERSMAELPLKALKPYGDPGYYVRDILQAINELKREGVGADAFKAIAVRESEQFHSREDLYYQKGPHKGKMKGVYQTEAKYLERNLELADVYRAYQAELATAKLYDYNDMIMETVTELAANEDLLLTLQEQYQYFLVDEHQDTNNAQNKILELLCNFHPDPNVFIVGDDKQAIYRFQGASLENFNYFQTLYPRAQRISLVQNYRSTQAILDAAQSILPSPMPLVANAKHPAVKPRFAVYLDPDAELYGIAEAIKAKISAGAAPAEIAILYRDNRDAFPMAAMFEKTGVPFTIESDQNILSDPDIKKLIALLRGVHEFGSDARLADVMHVDFIGIAPLDAYKVIHRAGKDRVSVFDVLRSPFILQSLNLEREAALTDLYARLSGWTRDARNQGLAGFFESLVRESGYLNAIMARADAGDALAKLNAFFDEMKSLIERRPSSGREYGLADFLGYLDTLEAHNLFIKRHPGETMTGRVRLMTAHRAKGQEFEHVYIINVFDSHWGNRRRSPSIRLPENIYSLTGKAVAPRATTDDERRLWYVALTRAKKEIGISYARQNRDRQELLPSQFIEEISPELIERREETDPAGKQTALFAPRQVLAARLDDREFVRELFLTHGLSVTALNNYLECPWKYFYTNLLRLPQAKTKHQMYGTAVHAALKDYFDQRQESEATKELLLERFAYHLDREPFRTADIAESLAKGRRALEGYHDTYAALWPKQAVSEFKISGIMLPASRGESPEIRLTGTIDKMEVIDGNRVNVVDYKTSKPKSKGVLAGATKNSLGNEKRQLVFYNLLLNQYADGAKYHMVSGEIDFIEPDEKGRYKKEKFEITKDEIIDLTDLIKTVGDEILNLKFWDKGCKEKDCEFLRSPGNHGLACV